MTAPDLFPYFFFFNDTATTEIYTLSLHDALPILQSNDHSGLDKLLEDADTNARVTVFGELILTLYALIERSEEHTSELQSRQYLVCRLLLEKKKTQQLTTFVLFTNYSNPPRQTSS